MPNAMLDLVHPPLPQGGEDSLAGRREVLGQHDVGIVEPAGSELVGWVASQVFDALAHEQGGPVIVGQGPISQPRKVPHERVDLPFALPQRFLRLAKLRDVGAGAEPFNNGSVAVPNRHTTRFEPAVLAIATADAVLDVIGVAFGHRIQPKLPCGLTIVRMQCLKPAPAKQVWFRNTGVLCPLGAEIITGAVGHRGPDELR